MQKLPGQVVIGFLVGLALFLGVAGLFLPSNRLSLGGTTNFDTVDVSDGYRVDNTERISGTGGASFTTGTFSSTLSATGETRAPVVETGSVTTLTLGAATTSITAAQACDSNVIAWAPGVSASSTLPTAAAMFADCLTTNGDFVQFIFNNDSATSGNTNVIVAAASTTLIGPGTGDDIIAIGTSAIVKLIRVSATEMIAYVETLVDAD